MNLLQPLALIGLLILPLIILLHLLQSQRRRLTVSSIALWRNLPPPTVGTRRRRVPWTLLLLLQLLVAALLVLALSRPALTRWFGGQPTHSIVILDTTTSMEAREGGTTRFAQAKAQAEGVLNGLAPRDRLTLIALDAQPHIVAQGTGEDRAQLAQVLGELRAGATGTDLAVALHLASGVVDTELDNRIIILSDRAQAAASRRDIPTTLTAPVVWPALGSAQSNQALLSVSSRRRSDGQAVVFARVANYALNGSQRRLQLYGDGDRLADLPLNLQAEGEFDQVWTVPAGVKVVEVRLAGDDALGADDRAFLSLEEGRRRSAVVVGRNTDALLRALRANPTLRVTAVAPEAYSPAPDTELTVFEGFLPASLPPGGVIAVNPPADSAFKSGAPRLSLALERADDALVRGLDFAAVRFNDVPRVALPIWAQPVVTVRDHPLIARGQVGSSRVVALTFDLKTTNLPAKLAFPLLLARAVAEVTLPPLPPSVPAGQALTISGGAGTSVQVARVTDSGERPVSLDPGGQLSQTQEPGLYSVSETRGAVTTSLGRFAVHAGSALESDLRPQTAVTFQEAPGGGAAVTSGESGRELWFALALLALAALVVEALIARR